MLEAISQLLLNCYTLRTQPPPAVASQLANLSNDDLLRCGRVTQLLRQSVKDFGAVGEAFGQLYETSFDADPDTLAHLQLLQQLNSSFAQWIEMVCLKSSLQGDIYLDVEVDFGPILAKARDEYSLEIQVLIDLM